MSRVGRGRYGALAARLLALLLVFVLAGCVIPITPRAQVDVLPPGAVAGEPVIAVAPNVVEAGDFVSVAGAGWPANAAIYVNVEATQDGEKVATTVAVATAETDGRFVASFFLPDEAAQSDTPELTIVAYADDLSVSTMLTVLSTGAPPTATAVEEASPTATALPATVAPTPTPVSPATGDTAQVVSRGLNLRSGPGAAYAILRALGQGDTLAVLGQSSDAYWLYVRTTDGLLGWVARPYTNFTGTAPVTQPPPPPPVVTRPATPAPTATAVPSEGWRGEYFANRTLAGSPALVRTDAVVDFDWGFAAPARGLPSDNFSARWTRSVYLDAGTYRFIATSDDGVRVWLNGDLIIDQWREQAATTFSAERSVNAGYHNLRVEYFDGFQQARIRFSWERIGDVDGWRGEYFTNRTLSGSPTLVRTDPTLDFNWGSGSPDSRIPSDNFSVRWTRTLYFDAGDWRFRALVDDGVRVFVNDHLLIDAWSDGSERERTGDIYLSAGHHTVRVEYYERAGDARIRLTWDRVDSQPDHFPDWKGEYWDNRSLSGSPAVVRNDRRIDFNWGSGSPDGRISDNDFSARWTRSQRFDAGLYRFYARADDGVRVWVDGERIINEWRDNDYSQTFTADRYLDGRYDLRVEYFERSGGARIRVWWERIGDSPTPTPPSPFADVNPTSGPAGATVFVTGGGFPPNTPVHVYLGALVRASRAQAEPTRYVSGVTDARGEYRMSFVMPATWPDGTPIEAGDLTVLVATENFAVEASDTFTFQAARPPVSPAPYISVNPGSGGPDTPVVVLGGGFPANMRVNAHLARVVSAALRSSDSPEAYASAITDGQGNFSLSFVIPRQWKGTNDNIDTGKLLVVVATDNFAVQASDTFDYFVTVPRPSINVAPASGGAGTPVAVSGGGFPADRAVAVYLGVFGDQIGRGAAQRYATTVTDRNGNYGMAFTMPATWPDGSPVAQERLIIVVATDDFSVQVSETFSYVLPAPIPATPTPTHTPPAPPTPQASLNLAPVSGGAGARVNAVGSGFPPATSIALYLAAFDGEGEGDGRNEQYATGVTDVNGNYALVFTAPERWPNGERIDSGRIVVLVATNDFSTQATALFAYTRAAAAGAGEAAAPTATATNTPIPPTATDTPAPTATNTATNTPVPPTPTATATATDTPVPPTATAEPEEEPPATAEPEEEASPANGELPLPAAPITATNPLTETNAQE